MRKCLTKTMTFSSANISFCIELILSIWYKLVLMSDRFLILVSWLIFLAFSVSVSYFISLMAAFWKLCSFSLAIFFFSLTFCSIMIYIMIHHYKGHE